jgi:hypothetical protein
MHATQVFRYRDYELRCVAKPTDGGSFAPTLIVAKLAWPKRPREISVSRGNHASEEAAIAAAYAQGIEWILNYG